MNLKFLSEIKGPHKCVRCNEALNPKTLKWIGINVETGLYTADETKATQGWFAIGKACLTTLKKNKSEWLISGAD